MNKKNTKKITKSIAIVSGYSVDLPAIKNRLIPFIMEALKREFEVVLISPTKNKINIDNKNLKEITLNREIDSKKGFYSRAFNEISSSYSMMKKVYSEKHDYVFIGIPSIFNLIFVKPIRNKQFIDVRDVVWEYLKDNIVEKFIKNLFRQIAKRKFRFFDTIITTNFSESKYFINKLNISENNLYLLTNGIDQEKYNSITKLKYLKTNKDKINISYIGNIGVAQYLETFLLAARKLNHIQFNIVGSGRDFNNIKNKIKRYGLKNVIVHGRKNWDNVLEIYEYTDILYAQLTEEYFSAIPSKLYEYLASGKCIVYGGYGEAINKLSNFDNVFLIKPQEVNMLVSCINKIIEKKSHKKLSLFNREIIQESYIREKEVRKFFDKYIN